MRLVQSTVQIFTKKNRKAQFLNVPHAPCSEHIAYQTMSSISNDTKDTSIYTQIDTSRSEIRLLKIEPSQGLDDQVKCSLHVKTLTADLDFDALSYAWGSPEKVSPIELNGQKICIARNLSVALPKLRHYNAAAPRYIWIDALSINQDDVKERGEQVQLMGKIFSSAARVISWLGDYSESSSSAFICRGEEGKDLQDIFRFLSLFPEEPLWNTSYPKDLRNLHKERAEALVKALSHQHLDFLKDVLCRPYFQRLWIIQEVLLARELVVMLGSVVVDWKDLFKASFSIANPFRRGDHCGRPAYLYLLRDWYQSPGKPYAAHISRVRDEYSGQMDIVSLKQFTGDFQVSDSRDRIVALLGIASDQDQIQFQPDYSMPEKDFVIDFCRCRKRRGNKISLTNLVDVFPEARQLAEEFSD